MHLKNNPFPESGRYIDTTGRFEVECPKNTDIIVFLGQSNSANYYILEIIFLDIIYKAFVFATTKFHFFKFRIFFIF